MVTLFSYNPTYFFTPWFLWDLLFSLLSHLSIKWYWMKYRYSFEICVCMGLRFHDGWHPGPLVYWLGGSADVFRSGTSPAKMAGVCGPSRFNGVNYLSQIYAPVIFIGLFMGVSMRFDERLYYFIWLRCFHPHLKDYIWCLYAPCFLIHPVSAVRHFFNRRKPLWKTSFCESGS